MGIFEQIGSNLPFYLFSFFSFRYWLSKHGAPLPQQFLFQRDRNLCSRKYPRIPFLLLQYLIISLSKLFQNSQPTINYKNYTNGSFQMIQHIKKLFLVVVAITCFTCFQRADFNLPLFAFAYFLWDYKHPNSQKSRLYYLFVATWLVDFIWLVYWGATWSSNEYQNNGESGASTFVLSLSIVSFIFKLAIIVILFLMDSQCKLAIKNIIPNFKSIFSAHPVNDPAPY